MERSDKAEEIAHAVAKGMISGLPFVGGVAAEILGLVLRPPLERRSEAWMHEIAARLETLERSDPKRFDALSADETFASVAIAASQAALRARHDEKRRLLATAVEKSAHGIDIDPDLQLTFVRFIDDLAVSHIAVLVRMVSETDLVAVSSYEELFEATAPETCSRDEFMLLCDELVSRSLIRLSRGLTPFDDVGDISWIATEDQPEKPLVRVTEIGFEFLRFISEGGAAD